MKPAPSVRWRQGAARGVSNKQTCAAVENTILCRRSCPVRDGGDRLTRCPAALLPCCCRVHAMRVQRWRAPPPRELGGGGDSKGRCRHHPSWRDSLALWQTGVCRQPATPPPRGRMTAVRRAHRAHQGRPPGSTQTRELGNSGLPGGPPVASYLSCFSGWPKHPIAGLGLGRPTPVVGRMCLRIWGWPPCFISSGRIPSLGPRLCPS